MAEPIKADLRSLKELECPHCHERIEILTEARRGTEPRVLEYLRERPDVRHTISDLAVALDVRKNTMSNALSRLVLLGLIRKVDGGRLDRDKIVRRIRGLYYWNEEID